MSKIKQIKQKTENGWSTPYPLGADVKNIDNITGIDLEELLYLDDPNTQTTILSDVNAQDISTQIKSYCNDKRIQLNDNNTLILESIRKKNQDLATLVKHTMISSNGNLIITSMKRNDQTEWKIKVINFSYPNSKEITISAKTS